MTNKKNNLNYLEEDLELLEELIRKAYQLISPISYEYDLKWLMKQDNRTGLFEKHPKCFLKLKMMGRDIPFFPICNRGGMISPAFISLSLKMVDRLVGNDRVNQDHLVVVATKLNVLKKKYDKEIPRPTEMASKKANVTRFINSVAKKFRVKK